MKNNNKDMYKWNLTDLYKDDNDPQIDKDIILIESEVEKFVKRWEKRDDYYKDPKVLHQAFLEYEQICKGEVYLLKPFIYTYLRKFQEEYNSDIKAKFSSIYNKEMELMNKAQFFTHNIAKLIPKELQINFLNEPLLKDYKHTLERTFQEAKYLLSEKEEKVITLLSKTSTVNWESMINEFVSKSTTKYQRKELTFEQVLKLIEEKDKKKRDFGGRSVSKMLKKIEDSAEYEINSILQTYNTLSELRGFESYDSERHLEDDIDSSVVNAMIDCVTSNFSLSQRYFRLYTKLLGKKKIKYHERAVQLDYKEKKEYSYDESLKIVKKVFKKLDPEFEEIVDKLSRDGRFDVFSRKGKSGGAFCFSTEKNTPTFILLNHNGTERDVLTLAHESGHAIHAALSQKHQHPVNSGHSLATAEVASTFFEDFTLEEIAKTDDKESRFYKLGRKLRDDISTIFRQVACYNFELELHREVKEKGFLNKEKIGEIFKKNMLAYLGDSVQFDEGHKLWWIYWTHIRRPFYVYSYASGLLISKSLQKKVKDNPQFIKNVKQFLSAGTSKSTKDIFLDLGIDISKKEFWEDGIKKVGESLDEFEKLGKELGKF